MLVPNPAMKNCRPYTSILNEEWWAKNEERHIEKVEEAIAEYVKTKSEDVDLPKTHEVCGMTTIDILSELRSRFSCFDEKEEPYYRALSEAIGALNKIGLISKQDAINAVCEYILTHTDLDADKLNGLVKVIMKLPEPVRHGKWLDGHGFAGNYYDCFICDQCKKDSMAKTNYCPHCGAKMEVTC